MCSKAPRSADGDVELRGDGATGHADLVLFGQPAGVGDVARGAEGAAPARRRAPATTGRFSAPPMPYADADHRRAPLRARRRARPRSLRDDADAIGDRDRRRGSTTSARRARRAPHPAAQHAGAHRRHLRLRARGDQRHDAAAESGLVLEHAAFVVERQVDALAGQAEPEPGGDARRDVASEHRRRQDHQPGALALDHRRRAAPRTTPLPARKRVIVGDEHARQRRAPRGVAMACAAAPATDRRARSTRSRRSSGARSRRLVQQLAAAHRAQR